MSGVHGNKASVADLVEEVNVQMRDLNWLMRRMVERVKANQLKSKIAMITNVHVIYDPNHFEIKKILYLDYFSIKSLLNYQTLILII